MKIYLLYTRNRVESFHNLLLYITKSIAITEIVTQSNNKLLEISQSSHCPFTVDNMFKIKSKLWFFSFQTNVLNLLYVTHNFQLKKKPSKFSISQNPNHTNLFKQKGQCYPDIKTLFLSLFSHTSTVCYLLVKFIPVWFFLVYFRWKGLKKSNRNENPIFHFSLSSYYNSQVNFTLSTSRRTIFEYNQL